MSHKSEHDQIAEIAKRDGIGYNLAKSIWMREQGIEAPKSKSGEEIRQEKAAAVRAEQAATEGLAVYEFSNPDGTKILVLAGRQRTPMRVSRDVNGRYYINPWERVFVKDWGAGIKALPVSTGYEEGFSHLTRTKFEFQISQSYKPFGGVAFRALSNEEISIEALLGDERRRIEAEAEHWANS